jgi:hypothetical protein
MPAGLAPLQRPFAAGGRAKAKTNESHLGNAPGVDGAIVDKMIANEKKRTFRPFIPLH